MPVSEHPRTVRTYKLRRGRVSAAQQTALSDFGSHYLFQAQPEILDVRESLGLEKWVIEIGFGMGEATWQMALEQPDIGILAIDLHTPGIGRLISQLAEKKIDNVRLVEGDAIEILQHRVKPDSVDAVRLFFPDPWPKKRHHKRRFIVPENLALVASRLKIGGALHIATDWLEYAENAHVNFENSTQWQIVATHPLCDPGNRPLTKFEKRAIEQGRTITDIVAVRTA